MKASRRAIGYKFHECRAGRGTDRCVTHSHGIVQRPRPSSSNASSRTRCLFALRQLRVFGTGRSCCLTHRASGQMRLPGMMRSLRTRRGARPANGRWRGRARRAARIRAAQRELWFADATQRMAGNTPELRTRRERRGGSSNSRDQHHEVRTPRARRERAAPTRCQYRGRRLSRRQSPNSLHRDATQHVTYDDGSWRSGRAGIAPAARTKG